MSRLLPTAFALTLSALPGRMQSINVDFEPVPNPYGAIPASHGGAAEWPGVWNSVSGPAVTDLVTLNGVTTNVALTRTTAGSFTHLAFNNMGQEMDAVLNDYAIRSNPSGTFSEQEWTFSNLSPGEYEVTTISTTEDTGGNGLFVEVVGSPDGTQFNWGYGPGYFEGQTYTRHRKTVTDGTITVNVSAGSLVPSENVINAIQLVRQPDLVGEPMCFADGTGAACPCSNTGGDGRGCQNSAGSGGALLTATGTTSPDTIVLRSSESLPSALTIFLQGNNLGSPVSFGDGLRCAAGQLLRLYVKSASGGVASAPGPGDPSITARCTALGAPIGSGERRYYQAYYRDPNASFCPAPQGATFNASQLLKLFW